MDQEDKKTWMAAASSHNLLACPSSPSETLPSSSKRLAITNIDEERDSSVGKVARMSSTSNVNVSSPPCELISFGSLVLDIVMDYLDDKSLKSCRQVCKSWEEAARSALMKRCDLDVQKFYNKVEPSERSRVELYTSWILHYNIYNYGGSWFPDDEGVFPQPETEPSQQEITWKEFLPKWGPAAKSLALTGLTLDEDCLKWIRNLLCVWCPNVGELSLKFTDGQYDRETESVIQELKDFQQYLDDRDAVEFEKIWTAKEDHAFTPYPILPNVQSLRVGKRADQMTSFFSINVLLSCPNLKHLFVSEVSSFWDSEDDCYCYCEDIDEEDSDVDYDFFYKFRFPKKYFYVDEEEVDENKGFRIIHFLSQHPEITLKLETFKWQDSAEHCSASYHHDYSLYVEWEKVVREFAARSRNRQNPSLPILQFSNALKSLHWNVLELDKEWNLLFPGVLEQVAGNLRTLDLRRVEIHENISSLTCGGGPKFLYGRLPLHLALHDFPAMPKLSTIQISSWSCNELSLSDLVDAAPNLKTLEISGCGRCENGWTSLLKDKECIWGGSRRPNRPPNHVMQVHANLKTFKAEISMRHEETLRRTVQKFPNLEQLSIGVGGLFETQLKLKRIFETLEELKSLRRFKWTICGPLDVARILKWIAAAGRRMEKLEICHLRFIIRPTLDAAHAAKSEGFLSMKKRLLKKILATKHSSCRFIVTTNSEMVFQKRRKVPTFDSWPLPRNYRRDWKLLLFTFIRIHGLPIEMRYSPTEEQPI
jgi:hypothetical protein